MTTYENNDFLQQSEQTPRILHIKWVKPQVTKAPEVATGQFTRWCLPWATFYSFENLIMSAPSLSAASDLPRHCCTNVFLMSLRDY